MNLQSRPRVLDPLERFSEIVFGLIMVLSFTCALSVAQAGRDDVRAMFIGALGCNLAWGIIDAAFYLIACLTETGHNAFLLRRVQQAPHPAHARQVIHDALPARVAEALDPTAVERIHTYLQKLPPPGRLRLTAENWRGSLGVFLLVFLSTFPVALPFLFLPQAATALRVSNAIAILMLFGAGHMLGAYAGLNRFLTGLAMVAITIALGG